MGLLRSPIRSSNSEEYSTERMEQSKRTPLLNTWELSLKVVSLCLGGKIRRFPSQRVISFSEYLE
jgi:hypothetical protein